MAQEITSYDEVSNIDKDTYLFLTKDGGLGKKSIEDVGKVINGSSDISGIGDGTVNGILSKLKGHAFNETVQNLTTEETGSALDASQGKVLQDELDGVNRNLSNLQGHEIVISESDFEDGAWWDELTLNNSMYKKLKDMYFFPPGTYTISTTSVRDDLTCVFGSYPINNDEHFINRINNSKVITIDKPFTLYLQKENGTVTQDDAVEYLQTLTISQGIYGVSKKIAAQNESLDEYGVVKPSITSWVQGRRTTNISSTDENAQYVSADVFEVSENDVVTLTYSDSHTYIYLYFFDSSGNYVTTQYTDGNTITRTVGSGIAYVSYCVRKDGGITPQTVGNAEIHINQMNLPHEVVALKKDLGGLKFSVSDGTLTITDGTNSWSLPAQ